MENKETGLSFRGIAIPEVISKPSYQLADSKQVIDKVSKMTKEQKAELRIDAVHYDDHK